jgi:biotin operon repressor
MANLKSKLEVTREEMDNNISKLLDASIKVKSMVGQGMDLKELTELVLDNDQKVCNQLRGHLVDLLQNLVTI